jgi:hypothetical protein
MPRARTCQRAAREQPKPKRRHLGAVLDESQNPVLAPSFRQPIADAGGAT